MNPPRADPAALARDLLRCPSVTPAEAGALGVIEGALKAAGFTVHRVTFAEPGTAPVENLYARIGTASPHFAFAGHVDVVPPGEQAKWTHPPFAGEIADGTLYGRGAVDMKGGIASALAATLDYLAAQDGRPKGSISFLITGDEEGVAVNGTVKLVQWAAERGETFDHCVLGEPSNAETIGDTIKVGRRGSLNGTLVVTGKQGHVAYPERAENPVRGLVALMSALMASPLDYGSAQFDASNLEFTSIDIGNHSQTSLKVLIEKRAADAAAGRIRWHINWEPSNADTFVIEPGPFLDLVCAAIKDVTGKQPKLSTSGGTSDARFIKNYCPVVEFGLVGQSMHQVDERTTVADLATLTAAYRRILERYFS
jgi:succinyl-diaminopimelate desuccinylase